MIDEDFNIFVPTRDNKLWRDKAPPFPSHLEGVYQYDSQSWPAPSSYNILEIAQCIHPGQDNGGMTTIETIVDFVSFQDLKNGLRHCLGLLDAIQIQQLGAEMFRKLFGTNVLMFLRDLAKDRGDKSNTGPRFVPCLYLDTEGELRLTWCPLEHYANKRYITLTFVELGLIHVPIAA